MIDRESAREPGLPAGAGRLILVALLLCVACMVTLAVRRAGWLDEYWTTWHSDPANPLRVAYWTRWIRDTPHPPTFYALAWSLAPLTGPTLVARRLLVNGLALLLIVPTALVVRRGGRVPLPTILLALVLASGPYFLTYFAEHRSYFLAMSAVSCLVTTVRAVHVATGEAGRRPGTALTRWLFAITLIATNLHYTIALCGLALLFCECVWQWLFASRRTALLIVGAVGLALAPLLFNALTAFRLQTLPVVVDTPLAKGVATLAFMLAVGPAANLVLLWPAARAALRLRHPGSGDDEPARSFLLVLVSALTLLSLGFLLLQLWKHNLIPRLLLGLIPLAIALVCELAARVPLRRGLIAAACANAALVAVAATAHELGNGRWEYHVPAIRAAIRACPGTRVIAVNPIYLLPPGDTGWSMTGQEQAMALSYRRIAEKWGFAVSVQPNDAPPGAGPRNCPTLIWLEHNFFRPLLSDRELIALARLPAPGPKARLQRDRVDSHDLLEIRP